MAKKFVYYILGKIIGALASRLELEIKPNRIYLTF